MLLNSNEASCMRGTQNYMSLPYNPALKERARVLRRTGNLAEVLLWKRLKRRQFLGLDFDRQKIIGNYIVDFYCAEKAVVIEVDGSSHDHKVEYDAQRDAFLMGLGLTVIHLRDGDVKENLSCVMGFLRSHLAFTSAVHLETTPPLRGRGINALLKIPLLWRGGRRSLTGWSWLGTYEQ
jgi:very-short-patch-repair endonuclease